jgi:broad specificity phosphatase PhoE
MGDPLRHGSVSRLPDNEERPQSLASGETRPSGAASLIPAGLDAVLVLLRHGQTQFIVEKRFQGAMEAPLTELGERQARLAGRRLATPLAHPELPIPDTSPFAIVHSPLGRARRSAELAVEEMNAAGRETPPLRADPGYSEIGQGAWEGLTDAEITARYGDSLASWRRWPESHHAPGGESLEEVGTRVDTALKVLLAEMADGAKAGTLDRHQVLGYSDPQTDTRRWSLIVAHGGVFRMVACALLELPPEHFWNFDFGLAAITAVEIRAGRAVLRTLNFESHLGAGVEGTSADGGARNASGAL